MQEDEMVSASMKVILKAGDSRTHAMRALQQAADGDTAEALASLMLAEEAVTEGHAIQASIIQGAIRGEPEYTGYNVLFVHAQDSLMASVSEVQLVKRLIPALEQIHGRLAALEGSGNREADP